MFRRKEETAADSSTSFAPQAAQSSDAHNESAAAPAASAAQNNASAPAASASLQPSAGSTYVPTAPAARPVAEPARAAAPAGGSYRPAPIAEFNRGAPRSTSDALRSSSPAAPGSSFGSASADKNASGKSNRRVLTVGNDILLKGEIATCDRLVIEGRVEAKLSEVHTVEIAECGSFKGTAEVEDAEISGVFEGDLVVRNRLVIYTTGEVRGNISYGEIEIERGGKLTGEIKTVGGAANAQGAAGKGLFERNAKETAAA